MDSGSTCTSLRSACSFYSCPPLSRPSILAFLDQTHGFAQWFAFDCGTPHLQGVLVPWPPNGLQRYARHLPSDRRLADPCRRRLPTTPRQSLCSNAQRPSNHCSLGFGLHGLQWRRVGLCALEGQEGRLLNPGCSGCSTRVGLESHTRKKKKNTICLGLED